VIKLVAISAIAGGAFTSVRNTDIDRRSIASAGASRYPTRMPGAMLLAVLVI
jgi:hypothetical protein